LVGHIFCRRHLIPPLFLLQIPRAGCPSPRVTRRRFRRRPACPPDRASSTPRGLIYRHQCRIRCQCRMIVIVRPMRKLSSRDFLDESC
jgi:hypothetical protein